MAEVKWIKIYTNIFDNNKIKLIEKLPDGDGIIVIWLKLLCLAGKMNSDGMIILTNGLPYTEQMLADAFDRPLSLIQLALATFKRFSMIEEINDIYKISNWERYQNIEGMEKIREQTKIRTREYRQRLSMKFIEGGQKADKRPPKEENKVCDVTVTHCDADVTHLELELDKELDKEYKKESIINNTKEKDFVQTNAEPDVKPSKSKFSLEDIINKNFTSPDVVDGLKEFIKMRKMIKKPLTERALDLICNKLKKLSSSSEEQVEILNQSIINSWQDIFPLKEDYVKQKDKSEFDNIAKKFTLGDKDDNDDEEEEFVKDNFLLEGYDDDSIKYNFDIIGERKPKNG